MCVSIPCILLTALIDKRIMESYYKAVGMLEWHGEVLV